MLFCIDFWSYFDPNLPPKIHKNREKSMLRRTLSWSRFLYRFLMHFGTQLTFPKPQKSLKNNWFLLVFVKIGRSKLTSIFDPILVPTWLHFSSENPPRSRKKLFFMPSFFRSMFTLILIQCLLHFGPQVGTMLASKIYQKSSRMTPKTRL